MAALIILLLLLALLLPLCAGVWQLRDLPRDAPATRAPEEPDQS